MDGENEENYEKTSKLQAKDWAQDSNEYKIGDITTQL